MTAYHHITADHFAALATGRGGPTTVEHLGSVQHSKQVLLLRYLVAAWSGTKADDAVVDVLVEAEGRNSLAVADLLSDPMVGAWAARTTRRLAFDTEYPAAVSADLAQIGALSAAAALRSGLDAEVPTQPLSGTVTLPTFGVAVLGSDGPAVVTTAGGRATVAGDSARVAVAADDPRWLGLRRLAARHGNLAATVAIEDGNPYRDCYHAPAADRLTADELGRWRASFAEGWALLAEFLPERAAELATGLRSVVPLVTEDGGMARSGTSRDVFGTLGLTRPRSGVDLAVTLVHEMQHSKLSVLIDLVPLYEPGGSERHFAPWRTDARPTGGLFQGVYAFLGVADSWCGLRSAPGLEESATREFAFAREQVTAGLSSLEASAELTPMGREFTAGLRRAVDRLRAESVPKWAVEAATESMNGRSRRWHRDNPDAAADSR